jgi:type IV pilus assembly protein PilF
VSRAAKRGALLLGAAGLGVVSSAGCTARGATSSPFVPADPQHQSAAEFNLGLDAMSHSDFRVALSHALRAVQLDDQNARATYLASTVYLGFCTGLRGFDEPDCRLADAEKYARQTVKLAPTYLDARNLLGEILINEKRYPEAIATLQPLTTDPAFTSIHLAWGNLGWAELKSGDIDSAIASLRNAVTEPRFCLGFYRLGIAYETKADLQAADANLTTAVDGESCKNFQDAFEERGRVRAKLGQADASRADFQRCKEMNPESLSGKRCADALGGKP